MNYKIKFDTHDAFSAQKASVSRERKSYTKSVAENNNAVEVLDRYDDFDSLKIPPESYRRPDDNDDYGIIFNDKFHVRYVVLEHQLAAAQAFLGGLRGFGLLADVVGSGKTYEAGIVLSELAARGKVKSLLIVTPEKVFDKWKNVIEIEFGLGKDALVTLGASPTPNLLSGERVRVSGNDVIRPAKPAIVKMEDFACWSSEVTRYLFDVIIVDEAHHLCSEEGKYAAVMQLLSALMKIKRLADKPYCLLLSATPHSGNLAKMFRLWYFVKCKGGEPSDFCEGTVKTQKYLAELDHYTNGVCKGAKTVMEFIKRVKVSEVLQPLNPKSGVTFSDFLVSKGKNVDVYNKLPYEGRVMLADEYLSKNEDIKKIVYERIASAYHNMLLRNIMIRQPRSAGERWRLKGKSAENIFFFKLTTECPKTIRLIDNSKNIEVDIENFDGNEAVTVGNEAVSVEAYVTKTRGKLTYGRRYAEFLISTIFNKVIGGESGQKAFSKANSVRYYWGQFGAAEILPDSGVSATHNRIKYVSSASSVFDAKVEETIKIINRHRNENIVVFFDYELDEKKRSDIKLLERLKAIPEISNRLIKSDEFDAISRFQTTDGAVLIVTDAPNTESVDLQKGNIVINFQVTPDPVSMDQRIGRVSRLGQEKDIKVYSLADMTALEGYILAYYARIGLLTSNDGDATIIAGSNSEEMVAVMCKACHNVELYYYEDYLLKKNNGELYCDRTDVCKLNDRRGTVMEEIIAADFKCNNSSCGAVLVRPMNESFVYRCLSINNTQRGLLCSTGRDNDRRIFCSKLCAMSHCADKLVKLKCPVVKAYKENNKEPAELERICLNCVHNKSGDCPNKCRLTVIDQHNNTVIPWNDPQSISGCTTCNGASCRPKPYVIDFRRDKDEWEAACPACKTGTLKKVTPHSFAAYIQKLWEFQGESENFCDSLNIEAEKVADIQIILQSDKAEN